MLLSGYTLRLVHTSHLPSVEGRINNMPIKIPLAFKSTQQTAPTRRKLEAWITTPLRTWFNTPANKIFASGDTTTAGNGTLTFPPLETQKLRTFKPRDPKPDEHFLLDFDSPHCEDFDRRSYPRSI